MNATIKVEIAQTWRCLACSERGRHVILFKQLNGATFIQGGDHKYRLAWPFLEITCRPCNTVHSFDLVAHTLVKMM